MRFRVAAIALGQREKLAEFSRRIVVFRRGVVFAQHEKPLFRGIAAQTHEREFVLGEVTYRRQQYRRERHVVRAEHDVFHKLGKSRYLRHRRELERVGQRSVHARFFEFRMYKPLQ